MLDAWGASPVFSRSTAQASRLPFRSIDSTTQSRRPDWWRSDFRHPIALHDGVAETLEKILSVSGKRGSAGDEGPKLPAQARVNAAKHPGTSQKLATVGCGEGVLKPLRFAARFDIAKHAGM